MVLVVKNPLANVGDIRDAGLIPGSKKIPWRRAWQPIPVFLPGEFHGQRGLAVYNPKGRKESDTIEQLSMHASHMKKERNMPKQKVLYIRRIRNILSVKYYSSQRVRCRAQFRFFYLWSSLCLNFLG